MSTVTKQKGLELLLPHLLDLMGRVDHDHRCPAFWNELADFPDATRPNRPPEELQPCTCGLDERLTAIKQLIEP